MLYGHISPHFNIGAAHIMNFVIFSRHIIVQLQPAIDLSLGHVGYLNSFGLDLFSRFYVFWLVNKHTDRQPKCLFRCTIMTLTEDINLTEI